MALASISRQTVAYYQQQRAIRSRVTSVALTAFDAAPNHRPAAAQAFAARVAPIVTAAQRIIALQTGAYFTAASARALPQAPPPELPDPTDFIGRRGQAPLDEVYQRPFMNLWHDLALGIGYGAAVNSARNYVDAGVNTDLTLASRDYASSLMAGDYNVIGWQRVTSGDACEFCMTAAEGFYTRDTLMPIHPHCSCGVEPIYGSGGGSSPSDGGGGVTVDPELGPVFDSAE